MFIYDSRDVIEHITSIQNPNHVAVGVPRRHAPPAALQWWGAIPLQFRVKVALPLNPHFIGLQTAPELRELLAALDCSQPQAPHRICQC